MNEHPIGNLMTETMAKIKEMVDVNTIIGSPITAADGTTVIPVSKVSFGFGAGGQHGRPSGRDDPGRDQQGIELRRGLFGEEKSGG